MTVPFISFLILKKMTLDYRQMSILLTYSTCSDELLIGWHDYFSLILSKSIGYLIRYKIVELSKRVIFYHLFL